MVEHWSEKPGVDSSILSLGIFPLLVTMFFLHAVPAKEWRFLCLFKVFFYPKISIRNGPYFLLHTRPKKTYTKKRVLQRRHLMPRIEVDVNRCKACYLCVSACPKKCLGKSTTISKKGYFPAEMQRPQDCIGCTMCYMMCPDVAITVIKE